MLSSDSGAEDGDIEVITTLGGYTLGPVAPQATSKPTPLRGAAEPGAFDHHRGTGRATCRS